MDLTHTFTVPASLPETWSTFEDIESVAGCFPGAVVTGVTGDDFTGTCKVKLGPIAMVYSGTGTFLVRDEAARRFVIDAKGKDKRGNGTAGAIVTAVLTEEAAESTRVEVQTDLNITFKPAQFGRGVIEDISNKLLQQFVDCLQDKVGSPVEAVAVGAPEGVEPSAADLQGDDGDESVPVTSRPMPGHTAAMSPGPVATHAAGPASRPDGSRPGEDDALDLGATVLPILARTYGPRAAVVLAVVVVGWLVTRRRR